MKWEYQLMRDMLERANIYFDVGTFECVKTGEMLKQAATVMLHWDRQIFDLQTQLKEREAFIQTLKEAQQC